MSFKKEDYNTFLNQAKTNVVGFKDAYSKFIERVTIDQCSASLIINYGRSIENFNSDNINTKHTTSQLERNK